MIVDIVRYAETSTNAEGRLQGNSDLLLSKEGVEQAQSLQWIFSNEYDLIFCSSLIDKINIQASYKSDQSISIDD